MTSSSTILAFIIISLSIDSFSVQGLRNQPDAYHVPSGSVGRVIDSKERNGAETKDALEGDTIRLACRYNPNVRRASKELVFYWQKTTTTKGQDLAAINSNTLVEDYVLESSPLEGKYDLIISSANYDRDDGFFECKIKETGSGIEIQSTSYSVTILIAPGPPRISASSQVAKEGEAYHLTCSSEGGSPDPVIQWFKDNVPIQGQMTRGGSKDQATSNTLIIKPTISDDHSVFRCTVWNRAIREDQKMSASHPLTVHYVPRVKVGPFNPLTVMKGSDAFMTCTVDANPPATKIRWYKNNRLISHELNHTVVNVVPTDSGTFLCIADNGVTDGNGNPGRGELELMVQHGPVVSVMTEKEAVSGEDVTMNCDVTSNPAPHTIMWTKEGDSDFRQSGSILRLDRVSPIDNGKYTCTATNSIKSSGSLNSLEQTSTGSTFVRILHKPGETVITPVEPIATSGQPFSLTCGGKPPGWPRPEYRWWREGNDKLDLSRNMNLTFQVVHVSQEGRYYCQPHNVLGKGSIASVYLTVNEAPSVTIPMPPTLIRRVTDRSYSLTCRARGKPKPTVSWMYNGRPLNLESGLFRVETRESIEDANVFVLQSQLHFESAPKLGGISRDIGAEGGKYSCVFDNHIGSPAQANTVLKVEHSPIVRHTNNKVAFDIGENATLSCKMSAFPEPKFEWSIKGRPIDYGRKYMAAVSDLGDDIFVGNLLIRDVRAEDYGDYLCRSWNTVGDDDEKTILKLVKKSAPDSPTNVEALEVSSDSVTLRWKESFNGGYSNTEFVITYIADGEPATGWKNESCRSINPCRVTGLMSRTDYTFKVMAINFGGHSTYSEELGVTTKIDLKDMPTAYDAFFDSVRNSLSFKVESTSLRLVAKIEVRESGNQDWTPLTVVPIISDYEEIYLKPSPGGFTDMRIVLCLQSNDSWCGYEHLVKMDSLHPSTFLREAKGFQWESFLLFLIAIAGSGIVLFLCCCCWKKRKDIEKKTVDGESDSDHAKVNSISAPFYTSHENKVIMNGNVDPNNMSSLPIYGTSNGGVHHQMNGMNGTVMGMNGAVMGMNGGHLPHNYYLTGDMNDPSPSCSNDTAQSDMWMLKSDALQEGGGSVGMNEVTGGMGYSSHHVQQQHFDQSSGQLDPSVYSYSYFPQDEYQQQPGDVETTLNLKNSMYNPYFDEGHVVYGTTPMSVMINDDHNSDNMDGSSKIMMPPPHHSQYSHFNDEDMDRQYSSSNRSTSGRVIREIIV